MKTTNTFKRLFNRLKSSYFVVYTLIFALAAAIVFFRFALTKTSLVWNPDGPAQHFASFVYFGKYLREIARSILAGHLVIPQYDFSIGMGSDILSALHYYVIGDPLNLVSLIIPSKYAIFAYSALVLFRFYLAGLAFCALAKYKRLPVLNTAAGSLIYIFSGYALYLAIRHPSFLNPFIYFPLIILGAEKIFDKKRPYLLILTIFISAISSFYFFYLISLFTVLYIFIRLFFQYKEKFIKNTIMCFFKFGGCWLLGTLMASAIFVPIVSVFLLSDRGTVEYGLDAFFRPSYYLNFMNAFTSTVSLENSVYMGFTALSIGGVIILFMQKRSHRFLKTSFIIMTLMMMFPVVCKITNGFSYVVNRWTFIYGLLAAFIFTVSTSEIKKITFKKSLLLCAASFIYFFITVSANSRRAEGNLISAVILLLFSIACLAFSAYPYINKNIAKAKLTRGFKASVLFLTVFAVMINSVYYYNIKENSYISNFLSFSDGGNFAYANGFKGMQKIQNTDSAIERYEVRKIDFGDYNNAILNETHGTNAYFSLMSSYLTGFQKEMGIVYRNYSIINGCYCDPFIQTIENIKYFASPAWVKPLYGISNEKLCAIKSNLPDGEHYGVYENQNYIPFGFTYKNVLSQQEYDSLSSVDKRAALVQALVLNDTNEFANTSVSQLNIKSKSSPVTLEPNDGIILEGNKIYVWKNDTKITLKTETEPNCFVYCLLNNFRFTDMNNEEKMKLFEPEEYGELSKYELTELKNKDILRKKVRCSSGSLSANGFETGFNIATPYYDYYSGITDFTVNFAYCDKPIEEITLKLKAGIYEFDSIETVSVPMDGFEEQTAALGEDTLENLSVETDRVSGEINAHTDEWLYLSIPYNKNWTAYVDGEKTDIFRANTAFSAIHLSGGKHTVELEYSNKTIYYSVCLSALGFACFGVTAAVYEILRKKRAR